MRRSIGAFLDRDGTLNVEVDFLRTPDQLQVYPGAARAVRKLNDRKITTCVISNQSGIARGYLSEANLIPIHAKLREEMLNEGATLDRIYYCPHHPTSGIEPYNIDCDCRKPKPGMLRRAERELGIDLARSFVVGDSVVDMQAGNTVGATTILVQTGYGEASLRTCTLEEIPVDFVAPTVVEAIDFILDNVEGEPTDND
ncbi:MAG: HAD family hydrolase [Ignavibacteriae bacterium]|nr:HAD family hydrolase [Ignavibacteriota bacterium]